MSPGVGRGCDCRRVRRVVFEADPATGAIGARNEGKEPLEVRLVRERGGVGRPETVDYGTIAVPAQDRCGSLHQVRQKRRTCAKTWTSTVTEWSSARWIICRVNFGRTPPGAGPGGLGEEARASAR
jgi:hypothetical protein